MDFPITPEFWWSTDNLSASIFLQGVDQEILPCGQGRIDSVKIGLCRAMVEHDLSKELLTERTRQA